MNDQSSCWPRCSHVVHPAPTCSGPTSHDPYSFR